MRRRADRLARARSTARRAGPASRARRGQEGMRAGQDRAQVDASPLRPRGRRLTAFYIEAVVIGAIVGASAILSLLAFVGWTWRMLGF